MKLLAGMSATSTGALGGAFAADRLMSSGLSRDQRRLRRHVSRPEHLIGSGDHNLAGGLRIGDPYAIAHSVLRTRDGSLLANLASFSPSGISRKITAIKASPQRVRCDWRDDVRAAGEAG